MAYAREEIRGTTGQDLNKMNENFMTLFNKAFGNINFEDVGNDMKSKISTQWLPVQNEGNLDSNYPLYIRFYIPPNVKEIKSTDFNVMCENYRMDSSITSGGGAVVGGDILLSISGGGSCIGAGSTASVTSYVTKWGTPPYEYKAPTRTMPYNVNATEKNGGFLAQDNYLDTTLGIMNGNAKMSFGTEKYSDLAMLQHSHELPPISVSVNVPPHSHNGTANISIPEHIHELNEGIRVSTTQPSNVNVYINDNKVATIDSNSPSANNLNIKEYINIGEWNTIKIDTSTLARVTVYGVVEILMKYYK